MAVMEEEQSDIERKQSLYNSMVIFLHSSSISLTGSSIDWWVWICQGWGVQDTKGDV